VDFDKGLGIGGAGRHDLTAETVELLARGEIGAREIVRRGPMPDGQLWQECAVSECVQEPVCVTCELCRFHCLC
jgi:hypothetical protein